MEALAPMLQPSKTPASGYGSATISHVEASVGPGLGGEECGLGLDEEAVGGSLQLAVAELEDALFEDHHEASPGRGERPLVRSRGTGRGCPDSTPTTPPALGHPVLGGDDVAVGVEQEGRVAGVVPDGTTLLAGEVSADRLVTAACEHA